MLQPIILYSSPPGSGPNLWKVAIVLQELDLKYEFEWIRYADLKGEPYESVNPNGRVPSIKDPNTGVILFESGAIIEYLVDTYDTDNKISYSELPEKYLLKSWLHFQMSTHGPMFGQKGWFTHFHKEKNLESAIERYGNKAKRICGVIERHLAKGRLWLVGDKCTYADLAFVTWNMLLPFAFPEGTDWVEKDFPLFAAWQARMMQRLAVQKIVEEKRIASETVEDSAAEVR